MPLLVTHKDKQNRIIETYEVDILSKDGTGEWREALEIADGDILSVSLSGNFEDELETID
jgi:predicted secreted protein